MKILQKIGMLCIALIVALEASAMGEITKPEDGVPQDVSTKVTKNRIPAKEDVEVLVGFIDNKKVKKAIVDKKLQITRTEYYVTINEEQKASK